MRKTRGEREQRGGERGTSGKRVRKSRIIESVGE